MWMAESDRYENAVGHTVVEWTSWYGMVSEGVMERWNGGGIGEARGWEIARWGVVEKWCIWK